MRGIDIAKQYLKYHERTNRKELIEFFKDNGEFCDPATTPWCAYFVGACERSVGNDGTGSGAAQSYLQYGTPVTLKQAQEGDIVIFKRGNVAWQGHVTYFVQNNGNGTIKCLGGNQGDMVCYANYNTNSLMGIRRP